MYRDWLPPLMCLEDYNGDWQQYLEAIYECFCEDFVWSKPTFHEKRFALKRHPELNGKEATFWHVISEGKIESERTPDLRRCERIRWLRPMIEALGDDRVRCWRNNRGSCEDRILIALDDFSYVVVLADRGDYVLLWTAYCVEYEDRRLSLQNEYELYQDSIKG